MHCASSGLFGDCWVASSTPHRLVVGLQAQKGQAALERKVAMLETHQLEVHQALTSMEAEAQSLYRVRPLPQLNVAQPGVCPVLLSGTCWQAVLITRLRSSLASDVFGAGKLLKLLLNTM